jgi:2-dehydropantoate 2-reductase
MRIAVFGAGVIGGYLAAKLAGAGKSVRVVARGAQLAAIRSQGLTLIEAGSTCRISLAATDDASELGVQDLVFVTLKAHSIPAAAHGIAAL